MKRTYIHRTQNYIQILNHKLILGHQDPPPRLMPTVVAPGRDTSVSALHTYLRGQRIEDGETVGGSTDFPDVNTLTD